MMTFLFLSLSILAIVAGGLVSAFSARKPNWVTAWGSAYLVLVVGIVQLGLIAAWQKLGQPEARLVSFALLAYNLGSGGVMAGTILKTRLRYYRVLVDSGGLSIAFAMALLLVATRGSRGSWTYIGFVVLVTIILIGMTIGLALSHGRHKKRIAGGE